MQVEFSKEIFHNKRQDIGKLNDYANQIRRDIIKSLVLAKSGHTGGPLGIADVMTSLFFNGYMNYDPKDPNWNERDRFVLSAGHMAPILYTVLARAGYFPTEELKTLRKMGSRLQGHPGLDVKLPGVESSTGSLGQGISIALGMAMSDKLIDRSERKVFAITGDGELQEGASWEAAMCAGSYGLDNFCWIVDNNDCQIDGRVKDIMSIYPLKDKFESFNFETVEIDGHNYDEIIAAFDKFEENHKKGTNKAFCIIAKTKMGKGVSFMEDKYQWHGVPPKPEEAEKALEELS
jgi:transketolase